MKIKRKNREVKILKCHPATLERERDGQKNLQLDAKYQIYPENLRKKKNAKESVHLDQKSKLKLGEYHTADGKSKYGLIAE